MATSYRVQQEMHTTPGFEDLGDFYVDQLQNGKWGIWEWYQDYSMVSGQTLHKGKTVRRYDPDAGDAEDKPARFLTKQEAVDYFQKWIYPDTREAKQRRALQAA